MIIPIYVINLDICIIQKYPCHLVPGVSAASTVPATEKELADMKQAGASPNNTTPPPVVKGSPPSVSEPKLDRRVQSQRILGVTTKRKGQNPNVVAPLLSTTVPRSQNKKQNGQMPGKPQL